MKPKGYADEVWEDAKRQTVSLIAKNVLQGNGHGLSYTELTAQITAVSLGARDGALTLLLDEVCEDYLGAAGYLVTALVGHAPGGKPGNGFFRLAKRLGHDTRNEDAFWLDQREGALEFFRSPEGARLVNP